MQGNYEVYMMRGPFQGQHYFSLAEHFRDSICVRPKWRAISVLGRQWCFGGSRQRDAGLADSLVCHTSPCFELVSVVQVINGTTSDICLLLNDRRITTGFATYM